MTNFTPDELKVLQYAHPIFIRMLDEKAESALNRMYSEHKNGGTEFLSVVSEYSILKEMKNEIIRTITIQEEK